MPESTGPAIARDRLRARLREHRDLSEAYKDYVLGESEATRICVYQPQAVPGLLQTARYAVTATATVLRLPEDDPQVQVRAQVRGDRLRLVDERITAGERLEVIAILDEVVLRRGFGGHDVMTEQLDHLAATAGTGQVTLVIMPTRLGGHAGHGGIFELIEFDDQDRSAVFVESAMRDFLLRGAEVSAVYRPIVADLVARGLVGRDAVDLIRRIREEI